MAKLNVNGKVHDVAVEADTPLLWVIREQIGLTGTKSEALGHQEFILTYKSFEPLGPACLPV